jgi:hypothetical protein
LKKCKRVLFPKEEAIYSFEDAEIFVVKFCTTELQREKGYSIAFRRMVKYEIYSVFATLFFNLSDFYIGLNPQTKGENQIKYL